jgi:hypothetical protein
LLGPSGSCVTPERQQRVHLAAPGAAGHAQARPVTAKALSLVKTNKEGVRQKSRYACASVKVCPAMEARRGAFRPRGTSSSPPVPPRTEPDIQHWPSSVHAVATSGFRVYGGAAAAGSITQSGTHRYQRLDNCEVRVATARRRQSQCGARRRMPFNMFHCAFLPRLAAVGSQSLRPSDLRPGCQPWPRAGLRAELRAACALHGRRDQCAPHSRLATIWCAHDGPGSGTAAGSLRLLRSAGSGRLRVPRPTRGRNGHSTLPRRACFVARPCSHQSAAGDHRIPRGRTGSASFTRAGKRA